MIETIFKYTRIYKNLFFYLMLGHYVFSQQSNPKDKIYTQELSLLIDNDVFLSLKRDKYYSSGAFINYRWLDRDHEVQKTIRSLSLGQRMFTPSNILFTNPKDFDRPYAGTLSAFAKQEWYKEKRYLSAQIELGWMGPSSLVGDFHEVWHDSFGFSPPKGWKYQINNSPIVNIYGFFAKPILKTKNFDVIAESSASAGSLFNKIRQDFVFRLGKFNAIDQSMHYQARLGEKNSRELYLFFQTGIGYNFYNSTIEGNFIGKKSIHTEQQENTIVYNLVGLKMACESFDLSATVANNSNETEESDNHTYLSLILSKRFK